MLRNTPAFFLFAMLLCGCSPKELQLNLMPLWREAPLECQQEFDFNGVLWRLDRLQFYLMDVAVLDKEQQRYQVPGLYYLGIVCDSESERQLAIKTPIPEDEIQELEFHIGVPFELNHANPLTLASPLGRSDMFWSWQLGHKFFRLDLSRKLGGGWAFHLGSTGCESPSKVRAPKAPCRFPNRAKVRIKRTKGQNLLVLSLDQLLTVEELSDKTRCMSFPDIASCKRLISNLGVEGESQVFSLRKGL